MTSFDNELKFEAALIELLHTRYGWEKEVLVNPTEEQLIANWAKILFENNRSVDRLGGIPIDKWRNAADYRTNKHVAYSLALKWLYQRQNSIYKTR